MSDKRRRKAADEEDDGELSDSAKAVLRLNRELEAEDAAPEVSSRKSGSDKGKDRNRSKADDDATRGDGRKYGAVTGIKLDFGSGGDRSARGRGGLGIKSKDGKE